MAVRTTCRIGRWGQAVLAPSTFSNHRPLLFLSLRASFALFCFFVFVMPCTFPSDSLLSPSFFPSRYFSPSLSLVRTFVFLSQPLPPSPPYSQHHRHHHPSDTPYTYVVCTVYLGRACIAQQPTDRPMLVCVMYVRCALRAPSRSGGCAVRGEKATGGG